MSIRQIAMLRGTDHRLTAIGNTPLGRRVHMEHGHNEHRHIYRKKDTCLPPTSYVRLITRHTHTAYR